jgi:hypothetical protein
VFERHGSCQPKTQIARHGGHGRHDLERVVNRNLRRLPYRGVDIAIEDVIDAEDVGDEDGVEFPAFENPREIRPVVERSTPPARAKMKTLTINSSDRESISVHRLRSEPIAWPT